MKTPFRRYLLWVTILTTIIYVAGFVLFRFPFREWFTPWLAILPIITAGFSMASFFFHARSVNHSSGKFARTSMVITIVRLFFYISAGVLFFLIFPGKGVVMILTWGILYIFYTLLEVSEISKLLRKKSQLRAPEASVATPQNNNSTS